tara:strand:- start:6725 stop:7387 length:663 start_codon:yes stop_codon:yes gene_type:complete
MAYDLFQQHQNYFSYDTDLDEDPSEWDEFFEVSGGGPNLDYLGLAEYGYEPATETFYTPDENASFMMAADPYLDIVKPATDAGMDLGFTPEAIRTANLEYEAYVDFVEASALEGSIAGMGKNILGALKNAAKARQAARRKPGAVRPTTRGKTSPPPKGSLSRERASQTRASKTNATRNGIQNLLANAYNTNTLNAKSSENVKRRFEVAQKIAPRAKRLTI